MKVIEKIFIFFLRKKIKIRKKDLEITFRLLASNGATEIQHTRWGVFKFTLSERIIHFWLKKIIQDEKIIYHIVGYRYLKQPLSDENAEIEKNIILYTFRDQGIIDLYDRLSDREKTAIRDYVELIRKIEKKLAGVQYLEIKISGTSLEGTIKKIIEWGER